MFPHHAFWWSSELAVLVTLQHSAKSHLASFSLCIFDEYGIAIFICFVNSFEECRGTWRERDGGELLPLFNPSMPQSLRHQYKAVPIKASWFAKCFCSEGTSPILGNKEVLGRGGRHTSEGQIWNEVQNTEEWSGKAKECLVKGHWSSECRANVLDGCRKASIKNSVNREIKKCY